MHCDAEGEKGEFTLMEGFGAGEPTHSWPGLYLTGRKWGETAPQAKVRMREASVGPATCPRSGPGSIRRNLRLVGTPVQSTCASVPQEMRQGAFHSSH